jgi:two-component system, chemotaxis family, sensor kinase CheA
MELVFDISPDEMPLFLAETEDLLQVLEEGLVRIEQEADDPDLIQALFRAAHTLKGMAGMIGHKRLVELTHALENGFDGLRKKSYGMSSHFIDLCLESIDYLRGLREEVIDRQQSNVDIEPIVDKLEAFISQATASGSTNPTPSTPAVSQPVEPKPVEKPVETIPEKQEPIKSKGKASKKKDTSEKLPSTDTTIPETAEPPAPSLPEGKPIQVDADISPKSIAQAARAFQIMMVLQSSGTILEMDPGIEQIEASKPVPHFKAKFIPSQPLDLIRQDLTRISEVDRLVLDDMVIELVQPKSSSPAQSVDKVTSEPPRLGEFMVESGSITAQQLETALARQKESVKNGSSPLVGQVLIELGYCDREGLEQATSKYMQSQRAALQAAQEADKSKEKSVDKTVRTSVERLDALMNLVGELITDRNRLNQLRNKIEANNHGNDQISMLSDTIVHVGRITDQLQEEVMHIRMQPVANVFNKFPRMVRDLAQKTEKELDLVIRGQDTELDRSVIEEINDPLIHLLRNSVDHGIESPADRIAAGKNPRGTVILSARHEQGRIVLTVEDDGKGIDLNKLKKSAVQKGFISELEASTMPDDKAIDLIFASGVSTAKTVSDISGRGVGMDIVRNNVERLNGTIIVDTHPGHGSTFSISLPLTLAIVPTLLVKVGDTTFAIPLVMVIETQRLNPKEISIVSGRPVTMLRDQVISLLELADIFKLNRMEDKNNDRFMVVVRSSKVEVGIVVDALVGEEEVVVKSLSTMVGDTLGISSAAILGDGQVALILDIPGLYKLAGLH